MKAIEDVLTVLENAVALNVGSQGMRGEAPKRSHAKALAAIQEIIENAGDKTRAEIIKRGGLSWEMDALLQVARDYEQNLKQALTNNKTIYHKNAEDFPLKSNSKGGNDE